MNQHVRRAKVVPASWQTADERDQAQATGIQPVMRITPNRSTRTMMTETKHTRGPWAKTARLGEGHDTHWYIHHRSEGDHGGYFAKIDVLHRTAEAIATGEANARLIAAAPELLEACKAMVKMFIALGMDTPSMPGFEKTTIERARAAIAKATTD